MSRAAQLLHVFEQDLQQDCADYLGLRGLMQELYDQLLKRDCGRIDLLNRQIGDMLEQMDARAQRRSKILTAFRLDKGAEGMQQLLDHFPPAQRARLRESWEQLGQLAAQCKRLNERNGKLLAMHHEILDQLLGETDPAQLYAPQPC
ncbi:flagellar export chaperone FlgN [Pseudomonas indica]|uniref:flagellar export chaperone FlgN n=1 Tax=Pseudomonas indica TaxID=137658 RepID=UPI003FD44E55